MVPPTHDARPGLLMGRKLLLNAIFEPGTGLPTAETKGTNSPARIGAGCGRNRPPLNNPPIRGNWLPVKTSPVLRNCVVADAVQVEPVSALKIPANREINRELCRIRPLDVILNADMRANSAAYREIPYSTKQGIISEEQGNAPQEQGLLSARTTSLPRLGARSKSRPVAKPRPAHSITLQLRESGFESTMSPLAPKADMCSAPGHVR